MAVNMEKVQKGLNFGGIAGMGFGTLLTIIGAGVAGKVNAATQRAINGVAAFAMVAGGASVAAGHIAPKIKEKIEEDQEVLRLYLVDKGFDAERMDEILGNRLLTRASVRRAALDLCQGTHMNEEQARVAIDQAFADFRQAKKDARKSSGGDTTAELEDSTVRSL